MIHLWRHVDRCNTGHYTYSLTLRGILSPLPTLTHKHARMNYPRARKWSRRKLSDTARGRPTEPRERLRIAHLSVNATQLHITSPKVEWNTITSSAEMGLSFSNPKRSVERNKRPHETCSQICSTRTYAILAISRSFASS